MIRYLFDVNILLALSDREHEHHLRVRKWLREQKVRYWASCPITQNGFVRVVSQRAYFSPISTTRAIGTLRTMIGDPDHEFWPDDISIADAAVIEADMLTSHKRVTDVYLLALAKSRGGALLTLDRRMTRNAMLGDATAHLTIIS